MNIKLSLTLPRGGWTSKKKVLLMYQLPIFPKCVSSQLNNPKNIELKDFEKKIKQNV